MAAIIDGTKPKQVRSPKSRRIGPPRKPRYEQVFAISDRSLAKVLAGLNAFLKDHTIARGGGYTDAAPITYQDGKYIGQANYYEEFDS